ncbi:hypothetical protein [uncultured Georgenia sp.]|uniref:hypothetical protein n=1 Tax=uncultured Georgenia sp. TaxID=378209 RepID=UPI0026342F81|nr:hypothetical protein [uncultured Georgenia sp.]HLV04316.1 hypothetical protein [Actinomycetaceae bacterium]
MSIPPNPTPGIDLPDDPEEAVAALSPSTGEDYDPPEVVDPDREASEADQLEQTIEVPVLDDADVDGEEL